MIQQTNLLASIRNIEMNPVRAKLIQEPQEWPWSSAKAHNSGQQDGFVDAAKLSAMIGEDWKSFFMKDIDTETIEIFRKHKRTGGPIGDDDFIEKVENITGRRVKARKPGPKPKIVN